MPRLIRKKFVKKSSLRKQSFKTQERALAHKLIKDKGFELMSVTGDNWRQPKFWWIMGWENRLNKREIPYITKAVFTQKSNLKEELGYAERT